MYDTLEQVKERNKEIGHHWFDAGTIRGFGTRFPRIPTATGGLVAGRFFVTSEQPPHDSRKSSIRCALNRGNVETVGEFCGYSSPRAAVKALYAAIDAGVEVRNDPYPEVNHADDPERYNWRAFIGELPVGVRNTKAEAEKVAAEIREGLAS